ncbi:MAG: GNAT family N-acetyltransferase [Arcobacter sp.]|nr:MAG: GNAT family N-acetyltransferase [Arcobacter sp.]
MKIEIKDFNELSTLELYAILQVREEVFIVEQNCIYKDLDNKDLTALHLILKEDLEIIAYLRILKTKENSAEISFGRVLVRQKGRGKGYAKLIVKKAIQHIEKTYKDNTITIDAQSYLKKFYQGFGFEESSDEFLEDGIPHICMRKTI